MTAAPPPHVDPATAAGAVALRFDRWFSERQLDLPPETRAQFVEMGMQALERWPERSTGDVLDELIGELDARLSTIIDETAAPSAPDRGERRADTRKPGGRLARFLRRGRPPH